MDFHYFKFYIVRIKNEFPKLMQMHFQKMKMHFQNLEMHLQNS
jgi:hypothetical protein